MVLPATTYRNTQAIITGTYNVKSDDEVLNCDVRAGVCTVILPEYTTGYWNAVYSLYVNDAYGSAATNNITIVAPSGYTVNNASTVVVNINNGVAIVRIASDTKYAATFNYCCATPSTKDISYYEVNAQLTDTILPIDNNKNNLLAGLLLTITDETSTAGQRYIINTNLNRFRFTISPSADNGTIYLVSIVTDELDVVQETNRQSMLIFFGYGSSGNTNSLMLNWMPVTPLKVGWKIKTYVNVVSIGNDVEIKFENTATAFSQVYAMRMKLL